LAKNSTLLTVPSASEAEALMPTVAPPAKDAPSVGELVATVGGSFVGVPSGTNSMLFQRQ
jgi:hypothetical protein